MILALFELVAFVSLSAALFHLKVQCYDLNMRVTQLELMMSYHINSEIIK